MSQNYLEIVNPNSKSQLDQAAKIINDAFLKQTVARKDVETVTQEQLKERIQTSKNELCLLYHDFRRAARRRTTHSR